MLSSISRYLSKSLSSRLS